MFEESNRFSPESNPVGVPTFFDNPLRAWDFQVSLLAREGWSVLKEGLQLAVARNRKFLKFGGSSCFWVVYVEHRMIFLVLVHLAEVRSAESGEVAGRLGFNRRYVSVVLCRCFRRGFVSRKPYKRGRERGYVYGLTGKGAQWILHRSSIKETVSAVAPPKPEKKSAKVPVLIMYERPKSQFDELLGPLKDAYILRTSRSVHATVPPMSTLEMLALKRLEESETAFLRYMSELKGRTKYEEVLAEVVKGYKESLCYLLRFLASTGAWTRPAGTTVSQISPQLGPRLKAGIAGPESGIRELSSGQESSGAEVAKEELAPDVSSDDIALNRWWNNLPTVHFELPKSYFPGNL